MHSDAVFAVPLVQLVNLFLGHLEKVCGAFRMEPAPVNAIVLTLAHDEAPGLRLVFAFAFAEVLDLALVPDGLTINNRLIRFQRQGGRGLLCLVLSLCERSKENALLFVQLPCDVLFVLIFAAEHFLKESLRVTDLTRVHLVAFFGRKLPELDFVPREVIL